jgi:hypothetical protein
MTTMMYLFLEMVLGFEFDERIADKDVGESPL